MQDNIYKTYKVAKTPKTQNPVNMVCKDVVSKDISSKDSND